MSPTLTFHIPRLSEIPVAPAFTPRPIDIPDPLLTILLHFQNRLHNLLKT